MKVFIKKAKAQLLLKKKQLKSITNFFYNKSKPFKIQEDYEMDEEVDEEDSETNDNENEIIIEEENEDDE